MLRYDLQRACAGRETTCGSRTREGEAVEMHLFSRNEDQSAAGEIKEKIIGEKS